MTAWEALVLGLVQGLTEFLPVSSSGHLVIGQTLFSLSSDLAFDALVHGATMVAIAVYLRERLVELVRARSLRYLGKLALATVPAAVVGLAFLSEIERAFGSPGLVATMLAVTGTALLSLYLAPRRRSRTSPGSDDESGGDREPSWAAAWWIGCAQAVAILPGISRSGSTIVTGLWLGLAPLAAAEFSFLLGIPAMIGAVLLESREMGASVGSGQVEEYLLGATAAFFSGLVSIFLVYRLVARRQFRWFGFYCWAVAIAFALYLAAR